MERNDRVQAFIFFMICGVAAIVGATVVIGALV